MFLQLFAFRLLNAFLINTYFQPDEYFQSLEIAHSDVFGYGTRTWEWSLQNGLRNVIYPNIFSAAFFILKVLHLDRPNIVVWVPKFIQAAIVAEIDRQTYYLSGSQDALMLSVFSVFNAYIMIRTFNNTLETYLTLLAFNNLFSKNGKLWKTSCLAAIAICIRPSNALLYIIPVVSLLSEFRHRLREIVTASFAAIITFLLNIVVDSFYYGKWTISMLNFAIFNTDLSPFYGTMPWHFYLTQAVPLTLSTALFSMIYSIPSMLRNRRFGLLLLSSILYITALSFVGHKELRFLAPISPLFVAMAGLKIRKTNLLLYIILNSIVILYLTRVHNSGIINLSKDLRNSNMTDVGFLMPCHSVPHHSYLHRPDFKFWDLTCEPPINVPFDQRSQYLDEADTFYSDPITFLNRNLYTNKDSSKNRQYPHIMPQNFILFEALDDTLKHWMESKNFKLSKLYFNSHFHDDPRRTGNILVYKNLPI